MTFPTLVFINRCCGCSLPTKYAISFDAIFIVVTLTFGILGATSRIDMRVTTAYGLIAAGGLFLGLWSVLLLTTCCIGVVVIFLVAIVILTGLHFIILRA